MIVVSEGPRGRGATTTAMLLLWVILILTQISLYCVAHEETGRVLRSPPRKERFSETTAPLFHAPSSSTPAPLAGAKINGDDPDTLYGDDKRVIHTGPNPLHN